MQAVLSRPSRPHQPFVFEANDRVPGEEGAMSADMTTKRLKMGCTSTPNSPGIEPRPYNHENNDINGTKVDKARTSG